MSESPQPSAPDDRVRALRRALRTLGAALLLVAAIVLLALLVTYVARGRH